MRRFEKDGNHALPFRLGLPQLVVDRLASPSLRFIAIAVASHVNIPIDVLAFRPWHQNGRFTCRRHPALRTPVPPV